MALCCTWSLNPVQLFVTPCTVACQVLCPWGSFRKEYWSGLPCSPSGNLPNPGIKPRSPAFQTDSLPSEPPGKPLPAQVALDVKKKTCSPISYLIIGERKTFWNGFSLVGFLYNLLAFQLVRILVVL